MAPNQYGDEDINEILEAETRQHQQDAARRTLGRFAEPPAAQKPPTDGKATKRSQPARRPDRP